MMTSRSCRRNANPKMRLSDDPRHSRLKYACCEDTGTFAKQRY
uniref:Uncharacterized protein n=1 Tax=Anguilla anguilla TaxID=7936 RepID=A0A0E9VKC8_ANGAN